MEEQQQLFDPDRPPLSREQVDQQLAVIQEQMRQHQMLRIQAHNVRRDHGR
jgi:hypothetical protein